MMLEDGRFLMSPQRYDQLIQDKVYTKEQLNKLRVVRVHPRFRVIALGLPVFIIFSSFLLMKGTAIPWEFVGPTFAFSVPR